MRKKIFAAVFFCSLVFTLIAGAGYAVSQIAITVKFFSAASAPFGILRVRKLFFIAGQIFFLATAVTGLIFLAVEKQKKEGKEKFV